MSSQTLTLGVVQHACGPDPEQNLNTALAGAAEAAERGAQLVLLQELHNTVYFCQEEDPSRFDLAEPIPGPSTERLGDTARRLGVVLVGSLFERRAHGLYHNTAVTFDTDGHLAGRYRKMHIPDDPGYYEKYYFTPGDAGWQPIDTAIGRLGLLVCWDQWFPEAARAMALAGAELLLYPSAIGWDPRDAQDEKARQRDAWVTIQRGHAVANALPVVVANRVGHEPHPAGDGPGTDFWGSSFVAGPQGEIVATAPDDAPHVLTADIDLARSETVRRGWPFLRDRRIDAYGTLLERYAD